MPPNMISSPYDTTREDVLWAVLPPVNESGTSLVDPMRVGDALVGAVTEIRGVTALPLNRSLQAMRALQIDHITSPAEVEQLAEAMGVDGVLVPSLSAWDPYDPPVIGMTLALYMRGGRHAGDQLNPRQLSSAATDAGVTSWAQVMDKPVAVASEHLDARNHQVELWVREYAQGRSDPASALNWRIYFASMDRYTEFAAYHLVREVMNQEWVRTAMGSHE